MASVEITVEIPFWNIKITEKKVNLQPMAKTNTELTVPHEIIMNKIYYLNGHKVMLDKDLAQLYQVTTGNLNKAVQRNIKRFPDDFMFQLTQEEFKNLILQNGSNSRNR